MEIKTNGKRNIELPYVSDKQRVILKDINGDVVSYIKTGKNRGRITGVVPDVVFAELEEVPLRPVNSSALNIAKTLDLTDEVGLILEKQNAIRQAFGAVLDFKAEIEDRFLKNKEQTDIELSELAEVARNTGIINDERYEEITAINSAQNIDIEKIYSICRELSSKASLIEIDINNITNVLNAHEHEKQTKESLGLGKVDNTSDIDKPISKAVQEALDEKVSKEELTEFAEYIERLKKRQSEIEDGIQSLGGICANPIPNGGREGQVLIKRTDLDGDYWWSTPASSEHSTEEKAGIAEIATTEEAKQGIDDTKIMTPLKVKTVLSDEVIKLNSEIDANADAILKTRNDLQAEIDENAGYITELQADTTTLRSDLDGLGDQVSGIEEKIPDTATSSNQLADKNFVNSSIATETATFKGTFNTLEELKAVSADNNDYGFVISKDTAGNTVYNRYKYNGSEWVFEYALNNSSFTSSQWDSINSGATQTNISQITTNKNDIVDLQNNKQDVISDLDTIRSGAEKGATAVQPSTLNNYAKKTDIPTKTSELENDSGFITDLTGYLQDTATAGNALTIAGTPLTQTNGMNIGPGSATWLYGLAVGVNAKSSASNGAMAVGNNSSASANESTAVGNYAAASGSNGTAVGASASAGENGTAIGSNSGATKSYSIALGFQANATAERAVQIGYGNNTEASSVYIGYSSAANYKLLDANGKIPAARLPDTHATKEYVDTTEQEIIQNFMDADTALQTQITGLSGVLAEEQNKIEAIEGKIPTNASSSNLLSTASDLLNATQDVRADFAEADSELQTQINGQATAIAGKQEKLTAGENITIENNVISSTGGSSYITDKITNCITEIPQDIKLELVDGTATLKAGSKVYVPNGAGKFDVVIVSSDIQTTTATNAQWLVFYQNNSLHLREFSNCSSGATQPSGNWLGFYNTSSNTVSISNASGEFSSMCSLPIAKITTSNGTVASIDQVFNGFGYIGSTVFVLPGVKGLIPNGRNADGSLMNIEFTTDKVFTTTDNYTRKNQYLVLGPSYFGPQVGYSFDEENNYSYNAGNRSRFCQVGYITQTANAITHFQPKTTFHALDYNDKSTISGWSMPSNKADVLTLGASGTQYTAPANGYFCLFCVSSDDNKFIAIQNISTPEAILGSEWMFRSTASSARLWCPAKKGDIIKINYTATTLSNQYIYFIYAQGENQ